MDKLKSKAAVELGAKGGRAGRGMSKVRGDADHYRRIAEARWGKPKKKKP